MMYSDMMNQFKEQSMKKVGILMGSDSDFPILKPLFAKLKDFGIPFEVNVMSAHRSPVMTGEFAASAREKGFGVIICAAGMAAHLAGVAASFTTLPIIGIPIQKSVNGLDSLLSTVQMPPGIPVATVAIDGAENAAILAAQIFSLFDKSVEEKLLKHKSDLIEGVRKKNIAMQESIKAYE